MIIGAHTIISSTNADADRAFLRDILGFPHVDVGEGWLIFGLPPSEVAVHPHDENDEHELYLMCDDVDGFVRDMQARGHVCSAVQNQGWGLVTQLMLPGGGKLGVYQPRHARPKSMAASAGSKAGGKRKAKKPAKASARKPAAKKKKKKAASRRRAKTAGR
jgi:catechol 2,3-dioxygenase-like lactoylglutathione lyase family enzyme